VTIADDDEPTGWTADGTTRSSTGDSALLTKTNAATHRVTTATIPMRISHRCRPESLPKPPCGACAVSMQITHNLLLLFLTDRFRALLGPFRRHVPRPGSRKPVCCRIGPISKISGPTRVVVNDR
jgi:hypothetical protein